MSDFEGGDRRAFAEHARHVLHLGSVEVGQVEAGECFAAEEHLLHVGDFGGVEMF